ncbi:hypothetical protein [Mucilaginibacter phyllosphaerae]|uniref:Uncharacterized protein n=1 Tax=Mucilaginibacter phyllosphaerae TaxID=1812349 RepID=A0A4Y8ACS2_9SPHI|nr:hypothetical protein [Mucilaginibacter phyllosphaerae]MBB3969483.1 hypothetical protein [Mucilaginibacter phyllosphaerae]TEW65738.1 hypothetical protein E2R65_11380 [Mucilaginibacter phyllosphaerae]GGH08895.1 hypothetical protein GCM10007352_14130 [Mucilaginibacter phyllosphaerae]
MKAKNEEYKNIPGWGMDADPENEPTYPMKNYTGDDHKRINYERSEQQPQTVEILMSKERPVITRVFGTSAPPSGLSGVIRRYAFQHSEDRYRHWVPLILADRINMFEGLIDDIKQGRLPNIIKERGLAMEWKYNRTNVIKKAVELAATGIILYALFKRKK